MTREEAVALLERYSNYDGMGIPNLAGCKEAMRVAVDALKETCPELAESEDEKARKWIYEYIHNCPNESFEFYGGVGKQAVLDYLEKQKEQKPEWNEEDSDILKDAICATDILAKDFKKDNPHLAKTLKVAKEWLESLPERFTLAIKQEWDEFDEDCLKRAVWYVENPAPSVVKDTNLVLWLKSLPGRFNLQPKQEWSEEDEKIYQTVFRHFNSYEKYICSNGVKKEQILSWLKSLRPDSYKNCNSRWKPSEEQMNLKKLM